MNGEISIFRQAGFAWQCPFSTRELEIILDAMREACGLNGLRLELTLTDDAAISRINADFLCAAGPTNIISFPPAACRDTCRDAGGKSGAASLVLSLDTLERESLLYGQDVAEHALWLLAHGMAHVGGLDHGPALDAAQNAAFVAASRILK